jgi:hypothetical protein
MSSKDDWILAKNEELWRLRAELGSIGGTNDKEFGARWVADMNRKAARLKKRINSLEAALTLHETKSN